MVLIEEKKRNWDADIDQELKKIKPEEEEDYEDSLESDLRTDEMIEEDDYEKQLMESQEDYNDKEPHY